MFILLTVPENRPVFVNTALITVLTDSGDKTKVYFTGGEEDYIVVTESLEDIYERIQSAEERYRK